MANISHHWNKSEIILFREDAERKQNNIKIGITVTEWHNRERWQYTNYTDTIPSIKKKIDMAFTPAPGDYHLRMI